MFRLKYKRLVSENIRAKCIRHPKFDPQVGRRDSVTDRCSTCYSLLDLQLSRIRLDEAIRDFERRAAPWLVRPAEKKKATDV